MKKLLLAVVLLVLLVVISYVKVVRDHNREAEADTRGYDRGREEMREQQSRADSLQTLLDQSESTFTESLSVKDRRYAELTDSLDAVIKDRDEKETLLQKQGGRLSEANKDVRASEEEKSDQETGETRKILDHYMLAVKKLPADLSKYERRVALSEIRSETARKFSITVAELNEIREANKLDY